jgi:hypothetical protein
VQIRKISNYIKYFYFFIKISVLSVFIRGKKILRFVNASSLSSPSLPSRNRTGTLPSPAISAQNHNGPVMTRPYTIFENQRFFFS